jgi:hypothetical protein
MSSTFLIGGRAMWRDNHSRRVLLVGDIHSFAHARQQYAALAAEYGTLVAELVGLRGEVAELREVLQPVVTALRKQADVDVATLRRQLEIALARLERDPKRPLN